MTLHALGHRHPLNRLFAIEEDVRTAGSRPWLVGDDRNERGRVVVVHLQIVSLGCCPDLAVAIGGHDVKHLHLALADLAVGLAVDEAQVGPAAVDGIAIHGAIAIEPVMVLLDHGLAQLFQRLQVVMHLGSRTEKSSIDDLRHRPIARFVQMDAVDCERLGRLAVDDCSRVHGTDEAALAIKVRCRAKEIDEADLVGTGDVCHGIRAGLQVDVVLPAVRQVRIVKIFMRDGREENNAQGALAVIFLALRMFQELVQVRAKFCNCARAGKEGFVVAEEGKHHIGSSECQPVVGTAERSGPQPDGQLVAREAQVAEDEAVLGETALKVCFQPAVVLHALGQSVADQADVIAGVQVQPGGLWLLGRDGRRRQEADGQGCRTDGQHPTRPLHLHDA